MCLVKTFTTAWMPWMADDQIHVGGVTHTSGNTAERQTTHEPYLYASRIQESTAQLRHLERR
jgi:hypothetical protein